MGGKGSSKGSKGRTSNAYFRARGTETELRDFNSLLKACMGRSPEELRRLADWRSPDGEHFRLSKKLSFILRHADNVPLETNGFLAVDMILGYLSFLPQSSWCNRSRGDSGGKRKAEIRDSVERLSSIHPSVPGTQQPDCGHF